MSDAAVEMALPIVARCQNCGRTFTRPFLYEVCRCGSVRVLSVPPNKKENPCLTPPC